MLRPSCRPAPTALPQPVATSPRVPASVEHHRRGEGPRITPSLGGWGMPEWDALLDPQPGCRVAEQAPVSREAGGEAHERLGGPLLCLRCPADTGLLYVLPVSAPLPQPQGQSPGRAGRKVSSLPGATLGTVLDVTGPPTGHSP